MVDLNSLSLIPSSVYHNAVELWKKQTEKYFQKFYFNQSRVRAKTLSIFKVSQLILIGKNTVKS